MSESILRGSEKGSRKVRGNKKCRMSIHGGCSGPREGAQGCPKDVNGMKTAAPLSVPWNIVLHSGIRDPKPMGKSLKDTNLRETVDVNPNPTP